MCLCRLTSLELVLVMITSDFNYSAEQLEQMGFYVKRVGMALWLFLVFYPKLLRGILSSSECSGGDTQRWREDSTCSNEIYLNFLHSKAVGRATM